MKFKLAVDDRITYERVAIVEVEAETLEAATEIALNKAIAGDYHDLWVEEEVDNEPYSVNEADPDEPLSEPVT